MRLTWRSAAGHGGVRDGQGVVNQGAVAVTQEVCEVRVSRASGAGARPALAAPAPGPGAADGVRAGPLRPRAACRGRVLAQTHRHRERLEGALPWAGAVHDRYPSGSAPFVSATAELAERFAAG